MPSAVREAWNRSCSPCVACTPGSTASPPQFPLLLQFSNHLRVRRVAVHCDDPRPRVAGGLQGYLEEPMRRLVAVTLRFGCRRAKRLYMDL